MYDRDSGTKARSSLSGMEEDQEGVERLRSRLGMAGTISEIDPINPLRNGNGNQNQERERGRARGMEKREEEREEEEEREREKRKQRNAITTDYLLPLLYSPMARQYHIYTPQLPLSFFQPSRARGHVKLQPSSSFDHYCPFPSVSFPPIHSAQYIPPRRRVVLDAVSR